MFKNVVASWSRWVGQSRETQAEVSEEADRRVWVRVPCDIQAVCQPTGEGDPVRFSAQVQNISRGGVNLLADRSLETGALLCVELPGEDVESRCQVLAYVTRVAPRRDGQCTLGCAFATELRDEELRPFEAKRIRPSPPDPRRWVRFPCHARVTFRPSNASEFDTQTTRAVDISPRGIGFHIPFSVEVGTMLTLLLRSPDGQPQTTILASVVRCATRGGSDYFIGCNFIRDLTEEELRAVR